MAEKQSWHVSIIIAAVGILGALIGSAFTHYLALKQDQSFLLHKHQSEACLAFSYAFDKYRISEEARFEGRQEEAKKYMMEYTLEAGAAVRRIAIFGDKQLVEALAEWYRQENLDSCNKYTDVELDIWQNMRNVVRGKKQEVKLKDLAAITVKCNQ